MRKIQKLRAALHRIMTARGGRAFRGLAQNIARDALMDDGDDDDWQPIETAPRDGTVVDLWHKDGFRITDEWWVEDDDEAFWTCLFDDSHFTHWKPITQPSTKDSLPTEGHD